MHYHYFSGMLSYSIEVTLLNERLEKKPDLEFFKIYEKKNQSIYYNLRFFKTSLNYPCPGLFFERNLSVKK